jgi:hypothetical protein
MNWKTDGIRVFDAEGVVAVVQARPTRNHDAYLIAAAPELLEWADEALSMLPPGACEPLERAIRAARGQVWE